jgi:hypothetical protein
LDNLRKLLGSKDHDDRFAEKNGCRSEIIDQINARFPEKIEKSGKR